MRQATGEKVLTATAVLTVGLCLLLLLFIPLAALFVSAWPTGNEISSMIPSCAGSGTASDTACLQHPQIYLKKASQATLVSLLIAVAASVLASAFGTITAVSTWYLPRQFTAICDALNLLILALPTFAIGASLDLSLGRSSLFSPLLGYHRFAGITATVVIFVLAYSPIAYFSGRLALMRISKRAAWQSRTLGLYGWRLARRTVLPAITASIALPYGIIFLLTISDPLVPSLFTDHQLTAATYVWLLVSALGDFRLASFLGLFLLVIASLAVSSLWLIQHHLTRHFPAIANLQRRPARPEDELWIPGRISRVALTVNLLNIAINLWALLPVVTAFFTTRWPIISVDVVVNTLVFALVAVILSLTVYASAAWLLTRSRLSAKVTTFFLTSLLIVPGATSGTGLALAYGSPRTVNSLPSWLASTSAVGEGAFLIIASFLTTAIPILFWTLNALGARWPRLSIEMAMVLGASRFRALRTVLLPASAHILAVALTVTAATSTVMVAPLIWVTSAQTPVAITHVFTLLDHAQYEQALASCLVLALTTVSLVALTRLAIALVSQPAGGQ